MLKRLPSPVVNASHGRLGFGRVEGVAMLAPHTIRHFEAPVAELDVPVPISQRAAMAWIAALSLFGWAVILFPLLTGS
jgi:hypothetical protein